MHFFDGIVNDLQGYQIYPVLRCISVFKNNPIKLVLSFKTDIGFGVVQLGKTCYGGIISTDIRI